MPGYALCGRPLRQHELAIWEDINMHSIAVWFKSGFLVVWYALVAMVAITLCLALSIVLRPLLIAALLIATVVSAVVYCFSPRFRAWIAA